MLLCLLLFEELFTYIVAALFYFVVRTVFTTLEVTHAKNLDFRIKIKCNLSSACQLSFCRVTLRS